MRKYSFFFVVISAVLWGIIGLFVKQLTEYGLDPLQIVSARAISACILLGIYVLFTNRALLKIKLSESYYFIGTGMLSFAFFNWCFFTAIRKTSLSVAAILLYTAPAFVSIFSVALFKEKFTSRKVISLFLTFIGCVLVTGFFQNTEQQISITGLLAGLGAGLGYALYSIFGKIALQKYDAITIAVFTFLFATIGLIPITDFSYVPILFTNTSALYAVLALGFFSTVLPFIFYTKGLSQLEPSIASIIATLEPVVATMISLLVFRELITLSKLVGIILVISAIIVVREKKAPETNTAELCSSKS